MRTRNRELIESFRARCGGEQREAVDNACKTVLLEAGLRHAGQRVRINRGRHEGLVLAVETIAWAEAEVRCQGYHLWFSLWHDREYFTVLNPSKAQPPKAARLEVRHEH